MQNEWFEDWFDSPYYHLLYKNRSEEEADAFVKKIVAALSTKQNERLLDLACGKGRHAIAFAKYGLDVTGVDLSKESIAFASRFENEQLHFYVHDMRHIFRTNYYDYVCNLFTSFGYFKSENDNKSVAASIFLALKPGGKFLIDFVNRNHAVNNIEENKSDRIVKDGIEFEVKRSYTENKFIKDIFITDGEKRLHFQESVNSFTLTQMISLFQATGLTLKSVYGNYDLNTYSEMNSPRMILLFEK